jgi:hypothetical protein
MTLRNTVGTTRVCTTQPKDDRGVEMDVDQHRHGPEERRSNVTTEVQQDVTAQAMAQALEALSTTATVRNFGPAVKAVMSDHLRVTSHKDNPRQGADPDITGALSTPVWTLLFSIPSLTKRPRSTNRESSPVGQPTSQSTSRAPPKAGQQLTLHHPQAPTVHLRQPKFRCFTCGYTSVQQHNVLMHSKQSQHNTNISRSRWSLGYHLRQQSLILIKDPKPPKLNLDRIATAIPEVHRHGVDQQQIPSQAPGMRSSPSTAARQASSRSFPKSHPNS